MKSMKMDIWVVGTSNQLLITGSYTEKKFKKHFLSKLHSYFMEMLRFQF